MYLPVEGILPDSILEQWVTIYGVTPSADDVSGIPVVVNGPCKRLQHCCATSCMGSNARTPVPTATGVTLGGILALGVMARTYLLASQANGSTQTIPVSDHSDWLGRAARALAGAWRRSAVARLRLAWRAWHGLRDMARVGMVGPGRCLFSSAVQHISPHASILQSPSLCLTLKHGH